MDDFELAVETPGPATPQQRRNADTPEEDAAAAHQQCTATRAATGDSAQPQAERTNEWVAQLPEPASEHNDEDDSSAGLDSSGACHGDLVPDAAEEGGLSMLQIQLMQLITSLHIRRSSARFILLATDSSSSQCPKIVSFRF